MPGHRINRRTFWLVVAFGTALVALIEIFVRAGSGSGIVAGAIVIAIPRLHDIGRSGWWAALAFAPALLLIPLAFLPSIPEEVLAWPRYGMFVVVGLGLTVLGLIPGHRGSNRFGEPQRSRI